MWWVSSWKYVTFMGLSAALSTPNNKKEVQRRRRRRRSVSLRQTEIVKDPARENAIHFC
jgi:hypothetical protein